jgi:O-antigen ligase
VDHDRHRGCVVLWLVALVPTIEPRALLQSLKRPASVLPIAFFALVLAGLLWSDAPAHERMHQLSQVSKLLLLPLLIYHFERSPRGMAVFVAFLISCALLALVSCVVALDPILSAKLYFSRGPFLPTSGIFVKNYIDQGQEFSLCAVALAYPVVMALKERRTKRALWGLPQSRWRWLTTRCSSSPRGRAPVTMPVMLGFSCCFICAGRSRWRRSPLPSCSSWRHGMHRRICGRPSKKPSSIIARPWSRTTRAAWARG